jgi:hypothetical protein
VFSNKANFPANREPRHKYSEVHSEHQVFEHNPMTRHKFRKAHNVPPKPAGLVRMNPTVVAKLRLGKTSIGISRVAKLVSSTQQTTLDHPVMPIPFRGLAQTQSSMMCPMSKQYSSSWTTSRTRTRRSVDYHRCTSSSPKGCTVKLPSWALLAKL